MSTRPLHAVTVDVEDYFHVAAFRKEICESDWDRMESRVEENTRKTIELLGNFGIVGTFFVLGWVAERFPGLVREISAAGHEIGCHSYSHKLIYELTPDEFYADTQRAMQAIQDACGIKVQAYRAPSFSITPQSAWALEILLALGVRYDSSIFPVRHDLYGFPNAPRQPFHVSAASGSLIEFPPPTLRVGGWNFPVTGGGYLRLLPIQAQLWAVRRLQSQGDTILLYFHPWELDPEQPRIAAPFRSRFRHYTGLTHTVANLSRLFSSLRFSTLSAAIAAGPPHVDLKLANGALALAAHAS